MMGMGTRAEVSSLWANNHTPIPTHGLIVDSVIMRTHHQWKNTTFFLLGVVLPQSWPMLFKKMDIACEIKSLELPRYLRSWDISKTEGSFIGPKIMGHWLPRYSIGYQWLQNSVMNCNRSYIGPINDPFFLDQNISPRFLGCSSFSNILVILTILFHMLYPFFWKASVVTMATLPCIPT